MIGLQATPPSLAPSQPTHTPERAVAIALVVLLHLFLLWIFLQTRPLPTLPTPHFHEEPITLWLTLPKIRNAPAAPAPLATPDKSKQKEHSLAPPVPNALGLRAPPPPPRTAPQTGEDYTGLRALGEYLYNCSAMNYGYLNGLERAHCLENLWVMTPGEGRKLRLGKEAPSIWKDQRDKRNAPQEPFAKDCAPGSVNDNLGLPCVDIAH